MNVDNILAALEHNNGRFPRDVLKLAIENKKLIAPKLLQEMDYSTKNIDKIYDDEKYLRHIYALYLLAQFRETRAFPLIIEFFSMPGDMVHHVTGDVITEDLGRILASTFDGNTTLLNRLVENSSIDEYVRSAALQAYVILWGHGILERQHLIAYFHSLFSEKLVGEVSYIWSALVSYSLKLGSDELEEDIRKVINQSLVDPHYVGRDRFNESLGRSNDEALRALKRERGFGLIDNTIAEMEWWACFKPQRKKSTSFARLTSNPGNSNKSEKQKIGRNDLCSCGSGKKYKKCCLNTEQAIV